MSWESVDTLPTSTVMGSPYQGVSEPVVAQRAGLSAFERVQVFWQSTPELPSKRTARVVVLTPSHVYVERLDGTRERARLEAFTGRRQEGRRVIYGVADGEDLALLMRPSCPLISALDEQLHVGLGAPPPPITYMTGVGPALALFGFAAMVAGYFLSEYSLDEMWYRINDGLYTAEVVLGVGAGFAAAVIAVVFLFTVPVHWRIDTVGVQRVRGFIPWLRYVDPPESVRSVSVSRLTSPRGIVGYDVSLTWHKRDAHDLRLRRFTVAHNEPSRDTNSAAMTFANDVGRLLRVAVER